MNINGVKITFIILLRWNDKKTMYMNNSVSIKKNKKIKKTLSGLIYIFIFPYPNHHKYPIFNNSDKNRPVHKGTIQPCEPWQNRTEVPSESYHAKTSILYYTHTQIFHMTQVSPLALFSSHSVLTFRSFSLFTVNIKIIQIKRRSNGTMWCLLFSRVIFRSFSYL